MEGDGFTAATYARAISYFGIGRAIAASEFAGVDDRERWRVDDEIRFAETGGVAFSSDVVKVACISSCGASGCRGSSSFLQGLKPLFSCRVYVTAEAVTP